ncbi:MAG TPA: hypothetical protein VGU69_15200 [Rhizomicrobium sp.]|nr:hypothetical protein [Rhizomicrobium sp.]
MLVFGGVIAVAALAAVLMFVINRPPPTFSAKFEAADVATNYATIKSLMSDYVHATPADEDRTVRSQKVAATQFGVQAGEPFYNLADCSSGRTAIPAASPSPDDALIMPLSDVALATARWSHYLTELGYPANVWQPDIAKFEADELSVVEQATAYDAQKADDRAHAFAARLAAKLAAYRTTHAGRTAVIAWQNCGRESFTRTVTLSPSGDLTLIPAYLYDLCGRYGVGADDPLQCNRWSTPAPAGVERISGGYRFVAHWPDGTRRCGAFTVDSESDRQPLALTKQSGTACDQPV